MEKYIILLLLTAMLVFAFCTFPVLGERAEDTYVVCPDDTVADRMLEKSIKWQTDSYFVYKLDKGENLLGYLIPKGRVVKEYLDKAGNSIDMCNPFMQQIISGNVCVSGLPYVID